MVKRVKIKQLEYIMGKKKKNKDLGPKRKRMKRSQRLQSAVQWMKKYEGKNIIKSYAKWFGVNTICAMTELEMLGMRFSEKRKLQVEAERVRKKQLRKMKRKAVEEDDYDSDETFAFIAGYTEGGFSFGITNEGMAEYREPESRYEVPIFYDSHFDPEEEKIDSWFPDSFDWKNYFGESLLIKDQEQLINELNKYDIQSQTKKNRENKKFY